MVIHLIISLIVTLHSVSFSGQLELKPDKKVINNLIRYRNKVVGEIAYQKDISFQVIARNALHITAHSPGIKSMRSKQYIDKITGVTSQFKMRRGNRDQYSLQSNPIKMQIVGADIFRGKNAWFVVVLVKQTGSTDWAKKILKKGAPHISLAKVSFASFGRRATVDDVKKIIQNSFATSDLKGQEFTCTGLSTIKDGEKIWSDFSFSQGKTESLNQGKREPRTKGRTAPLSKDKKMPLRALN